MTGSTLNAPIQSAIPQAQVAVPRTRENGGAASTLAAREGQALRVPRALLETKIDVPAFAKGTLQTPRDLRRVPDQPWRDSELARWDRDAVLAVMAASERLESGQLAAAAALLEKAPAHVSNDPLVVKMRATLAPPSVRPCDESDRDRSAEYGWLRTHAAHYRGLWVALDGDLLVASAPTLRQLREEMSAMPLTRAPLLHRVE
jgi:hypothetical protein